MRIYTLHLPPPYTASDPCPVAVREGFNLWAFLFTALWALWHRMWLEALVLVLVALALSGFAALFGAGETVSAILSLVFMLLVGFHANDWRRAALGRRGYREQGVAAAEDEDAAIRRHADREAARNAGRETMPGITG